MEPKRVDLALLLGGYCPCLSRVTHVTYLSTESGLGKHCDGVRPICKSCITKATPCNYSVTPGMTQQQAMKNQMEAYKHVLSLIRESTLEDAEVLVKMIKARDSLSDAVLDIQKMTQQKY
ncbi:hypothetical protein E4T48_04387 [Aureobasidium sp. EXF-10727]|nr:hypothetical protein E4T48_04387 [Aureobasidium sp. EXF-10727]KAI4724681.1 hypothetical protein E4T49_07615 [Aureobasidium sp. EXF-10728]